MRWLIVLLQCAYPLLLLLASASRASLPSFLYLISFFSYLTWLPLKELASNVFMSNTVGIDVGFSPTPIKTGFATLRSQKSQHSLALATGVLSTSSSFNAGQGGADISGASAASTSSSTWILTRGYFVLMAVISGAWLFAQLVVHTFMWTNVWRPDDINDGQPYPIEPSALLNLLRTLSFAPWPGAKDGLQSLIPDVTIFGVSIVFCLLTRMTGDKIRWRIALIFERDDAWLNGFSNSITGNATMMRSATAAIDASMRSVSTPMLILHLLLGLCVFLAATLQPSLIALPYFLTMIMMICMFVFYQPAQDGERHDAASISYLQAALYGHGSKQQYVLLTISSLYFMLHLTTLHVFQWTVVQTNTDMTSPWLGRFGLFQIDISMWHGVSFFQWLFLITLAGCLVVISIKRLSIVAANAIPTFAPAPPRKPPTIAIGTGATGSSIDETTVLTSPVATTPRAMKRAVSEETKTSSTLAVPSHGPPTSPGGASSSSSSTGSTVRRSFFSQSSYELKSFLQRSFRNHGLLLIFGLIFVQVMMVQDLFNAGNALILLICMSLANRPRYRKQLIHLLQFSVVYLVLTSFIKYLYYIPSLIDSHIHNPSDYESATVLEIFGLVKHQDGFTQPSERKGLYVCFYLFDAILPAVLIAVYLIVNQRTQQNLNILNLFNAASTGDTHLLHRFIEHSPELMNVRDRQHKTILHVSSKHGHVATTRLIMDYVDCNAQDKYGNTALHVAYAAGWDSIVHILLSSGTKSSGRQSLNLVNPDLLNKKGLKAREMKRSWWVRVKRQMRRIFLVIQQLFYTHASKLALLLVYFVASQSVNILHLIYFCFFLTFFSMESVARRCWNILVAYCAAVFFLLYTFSIVEPIYAYATAPVNEGTDWIRYIGLFAVRDDGNNDTKVWWSKLAIYYGVYALAIVQKLLYRRGQELGLIDSTIDTSAQHPLSSPHDFDTYEDEEEHARTVASELEDMNRPASKVQRALVILLTYATLTFVAIYNISLFHLGYLCIVLIAFCLHQFSRRAVKLLSAFMFLCVLYCAGVLFSMYAFLLPEFRRWLERHVNWERFTLYDIGFRTRSDGGNTVLLVLLPPTACFVMCVYCLKALWRDVQSKRAAPINAAAPTTTTGATHRPSRSVVPKYATLPSKGRPARVPQLTLSSRAMPQKTEETLGAHRRLSSSPSAESHSPMTPGERKERKSSFDLPSSHSSTTINIQESPEPFSGTYHGDSAAAGLSDFHILSHEQSERLQAIAYSVYVFFVHLLARQTTQIITIFLIFYILLIDPLTALHSIYLLILLFWLPIDGRSLDNTLWIPVTFYSIPLVLAKYLFQFPGIVAQDQTTQYVGFRDFNGQVIRGLICDIILITLATVSRVANRTLKTMELGEHEMSEDDDSMRPAMTPTHLPEDAEKQLGALMEEEDVAIHHIPPPTQRATSNVRIAGEEKKGLGAEDIHEVASPLKFTSSSPDDLPTYPLPSKSKLTTSVYIRAVIRELWYHGRDVTSTFFTNFGFELFLLIFLLGTYERSNVLSLVYVIGYVSIWMYSGGRQAWIRSSFVYGSLLFLLALSLLWQYLVLLGMPPGWLESHNYRWAGWDGIVQEWLVVGYFSTNDMMWDMWSFVLLSWYLPAWRAERMKLKEDDQMGNAWFCINADDASSTSPLESSYTSGESTPQRQQERSLLSSQDRQNAAEEGKQAAESQQKQYAASTSEQMYVPPTLFGHGKTEASESPPPPPTSESQEPMDRAMRHPNLINLWSNIVFYSALIMDKAIFLFIFFIGTSHNNLFSCVYLIFSCWYVQQNYLFDLHIHHFRDMWMRLRNWNFFILVIFIIYQVPWMPYLFLSDANLRWEMTIGLHRFVLPPDNSRFNTASYLRVYTDPLSSRGALPQILIFLLIEIQLLILQSNLFRTYIVSYMTDIRRMSEVRRQSSVLLYKEWLITRIKAILLFREKIEANFTYVFLEANKLNPDFFQDEMMWPQPKPRGWDELVKSLLLEDAVKQYAMQQKDAQKPEGIVDPEAGRKAVAAATASVASPSSSPTPTIAQLPQTKSTSARPVGEVALVGEEMMHAFEGATKGPLQASPSPPPPSSQSSIDPATAVKKSESVTHTTAELEQIEIEKKEALHHKKKKRSIWERISFWLRHPLLGHIDHVFWTEYREDPKTHELIVVSIPQPESLSLLQTLWRFLLSNTQWLCFSLYFLNLMVNGNVMAAVIPVGILAYAIFERPRVGPGFWFFCMLYTSIVVSLKFVFQLYIFCVSIDTSSTATAGALEVDRVYTFAPSPFCAAPSVSDGYSTDAIFGLRKFATHTYFTFVLMDMVCLLSIVFHRTIMHSRGLWYLNEEEEMARMERQRIRQHDQQAIEDEQTMAMLQKKKQPKVDGAVASTVEHTLAQQNLTPHVKPMDFEEELMRSSSISLSPMPPLSHSRHPSSSTVSDLTQADGELQLALYLLQREEESREAEARKYKKKDGSTVATGYLSKARSFIGKYWRRYMPREIQWYYDSLMPREKFHSVNVHKPGYDLYIFIFVIELFSAIWILICYDYMASTSLNSVTSSLSTNLFSGNMVLTLFIQISIIIVDRVCYLFRSMMSKLLLQYGTLLFWFIKIFIDWPVSSQSGFLSNSWLQFFFLMKLIYFICSGLQIYTGYPPAENTGFQILTRYPGIYLVLFYRIYRALPFVFELRTMLDWMCSISALDLWDSLKLEEIHGSLYVVQCDILYRRTHQRGTKRDLAEKLCCGVFLFILLLAIIFGPLLLFSTANPVSQNNPVASASISISLTGQQGEYPLVHISSYTLQSISDADYVALQNADIIQGSDRMDSIQDVQMASFSDEIWSISPPSLTSLMNNLNDNSTQMSLKFQSSFTRTSGPATSKVIGNTIIKSLPQEIQSHLATLIRQSQSNMLTSLQSQGRNVDDYTIELNELDEAPRNPDIHSTYFAYDDFDRVQNASNNSVLIPNVYPIYLRLPATSDPIELDEVSARSDLTLTLDVSHQGVGTPIIRWWFANATDTNTGAQSNIKFVCVSNRIFAGPLSNLSYSIVAVYITILFTIGQFVRLAFGNQVGRISIDDLPNANKLVQIVEGIYIARQKKQLAKEEILYRRLLKVYRTGPLLLALTTREDTAEEKRIAKMKSDNSNDDDPKSPKSPGMSPKLRSRKPHQGASPPPITKPNRAQSTTSDERKSA